MVDFSSLNLFYMTICHVQLLHFDPNTDGTNPEIVFKLKA